ncbi:protein-tyrosine-phosphatase [Zafaria cholistanensis]|uniref:Protein-tyrosine-phosphatase n=1 Tax=Zafaria cholistanensis TaxID=1682741 RepID=A0A5A7NRN6_9MICC|nr:tyrosine-protein phosphatase [Zafaria cholistanensis]GER22478.1 protein-tyrosine-phosphatase [Zafaria cholistanensis]
MEKVHWEGAVNARRVLGDVYRMGRSEWLTARGWRQAYDDGVRTVIDLRNLDERVRRATDPEATDVANVGIAVVHCPTEDTEHEAYPLALPYLNHPRYYLENVRIFPDLIANVFRALAAAEGKVVLNCSAGRDRTGLVVTLLLLLAGRPELVGPQYDAGVRGINEWRRTSPVRHPHERYLTESEMARALAERQQALAEFAGAVSVRELLVEQGVTAAEIAAVRRKLLGPSG